MSTPRIMQARVPQGSVLSPTLFNMYINTPQAIGVHLALFADDTCLYATGRKEGYVLKKNFSVGSTQAIYFSHRIRPLESLLTING
jgi:hypothetical protein